MTRKIALEEHFLVEGFANMGQTEGSGSAAAFRRQAAERLPEIDALRLEAMDKAGILFHVDGSSFVTSRSNRFRPLSPRRSCRMRLPPSPLFMTPIGRPPL